MTERAHVLLMDTAAHLDGLVDTVIDYGVGILPSIFNRPRHQQAPPLQMADTVSRNVQVFAEHGSTKAKGRGHRINSGEALAPRGGLWFDVRVNKFQSVPTECYVRWGITNTGAIAMAQRCGFEKPTEGDRRWEGLQYRGVHMAEAFIIRRNDDRVVGQSAPFYVVIK